MSMLEIIISKVGPRYESPIKCISSITIKLTFDIHLIPCRCKESNFSLVRIIISEFLRYSLFDSKSPVEILTFIEVPSGLERLSNFLKSEYFSLASARKGDK